MIAVQNMITGHLVVQHCKVTRGRPGLHKLQHCPSNDSSDMGATAPSTTLSTNMNISTFVAHASKFTMTSLFNAAASASMAFLSTHKSSAESDSKDSSMPDAFTGCATH